MSTDRIELPFVAGLLSTPTRIPEVVDKVPEDAISNKYVKFVYQLILKRYTKGKLTDSDVLARLIHSKSIKGERKSIQAFALKISSFKDPSREGFNYLVDTIIKDYRRGLMIVRVASVAESLRDGSVKNARKTILQLANELDSKVHEGPVGKLTNDAPDRLKRQFMQARDGGNDARTLTGFQTIDGLTGGGKRGDLWLICAHVSEGKTSYMVELAYRAFVEQGKNVVFVSLEMSREEIELALAVRHAHKIQAGGVSKKEAELGTLNRHDTKIYLKALEDLKKPRKGNILVWQAPSGINIKTLQGKLQSIQDEFDIDLVCIDYLELMGSTRRRSNYRIEVTETIKAAKRMAQTFNDGRGIWVVSGHQISRTGRDKAEKRGYYVLSDLAETAGAERTANVVLCLLQTTKMLGNHEIKINMPKNRSGQKLMGGYLVMADWAHGLISEISEEDLWTTEGD